MKLITDLSKRLKWKDKCKKYWTHCYISKRTAFGS